MYDLTFYSSYLVCTFHVIAIPMPCLNALWHCHPHISLFLLVFFSLLISILFMSLVSDQRPTACTALVYVCVVYIVHHVLCAVTDVADCGCIVQAGQQP